MAPTLASLRRRRRGEFEVGNLNHEYLHAAIASLGVTFSPLKVRGLTRAEFNATAVATRDPARPFDYDEQLTETGRVFADLAAGFEQQPMHMSLAITVSKEPTGRTRGRKQADRLSISRGEPDQSHVDDSQRQGGAEVLAPCRRDRPCNLGVPVPATRRTPLPPSDALLRHQPLASIPDRESSSNPLRGPAGPDLDAARPKRRSRPSPPQQPARSATRPARRHATAPRSQSRSRRHESDFPASPRRNRELPSRPGTAHEMPPEGLEHLRFPSGNAGVSESGGSKSGNKGGGFGPPTPPATPTDPELAAVVAAWPDLPPAIRAGVLALVKAATPTTPPTAPSGPAGGTGGPTTLRYSRPNPRPKGCGNGRGTGQSLFLQPEGGDAWNGSRWWTG